MPRGKPDVIAGCRLHESYQIRLAAAISICLQNGSRQFWIEGPPMFRLLDRVGGKRCAQCLEGGDILGGNYCGAKPTKQMTRQPHSRQATRPAHHRPCQWSPIAMASGKRCAQCLEGGDILGGNYCGAKTTGRITRWHHLSGDSTAGPIRGGRKRVSKI